MVSRDVRRMVVAPLAVVLLLGACGTDPDTDTGDRPEASGSVDPSSAPSSPEGSEAEPSEEAEPTITPATGPELVLSRFEEEKFRLRLPEGPRWEVSSDRQSASLPTPTSEWYVTGGIVPAAVGKGPDFYARGALRGFRVIEAEVERQDDITVDGVEGYVLEGTTLSGQFVWSFGTAVDDSALTLTFEAPRDTPKARAWLESMIASAEWL